MFLAKTYCLIVSVVSGNELELEKLHITEKDPEECLQTLGDGMEESGERSLYSCLSAFTAKETLSYPNAYECEKCCLPQNKKVVFCYCF